MSYHESDPVGDDEFLLRAIPNSVNYIKQSMQAWRIDPYAFRPNKNRDPDGMSFFREDFVSRRKVSKACRHPDGARVARLRAKDVRALDVTIKPDPRDDELPGHVIIPEMNFAASKDQARRRKIQDLEQKLAALAGEQSLYRPWRLPLPTHPVK